MKPLPFKVEPKREVRAIGNEEIGILEFPVHRYLIAGERIMINEREFNASLYENLGMLSEAIKEDRSVDPSTADLKAARILSGRMGIPVVLTPEENDLRTKHIGIVARADRELGELWDQQVLRTVTALIVYRLPGCKDWTIQDTAELAEPLRDAIYAFAQEEQNGGPSERTPEEVVQEIADSLGKPLEEPMRSPVLTGVSSTGDAGSSGQVIQTSLANDSLSSQSTTSSRRSRKESDS